MASPLGFALLNLISGIGQGYVGKKEALRQEGLEEERTLSQRQFETNLFNQREVGENQRFKERQTFEKGEREAKEKSDIAEREDRQTFEADQAAKNRIIQSSEAESRRIQAQADLFRAQNPGRDSQFDPHRMIAEAVSDYMIKLAAGGIYEPSEIEQFGTQFGNSLTSIFKAQGILPPDPPSPGGGEVSTGDPAVDAALKLETEIRQRNMQNVGRYNFEPRGEVNITKSLRY